MRRHANNTAGFINADGAVVNALLPPLVFRRGDLAR